MSTQSLQSLELANPPQTLQFPVSLQSTGSSGPADITELTKYALL